MKPKYYELKRKILQIGSRLGNNVDNYPVKDCRMNYYFRKHLKANGINYEFYRKGIGRNAPYGTLVVGRLNLYIEFQELNYTKVSIIGQRGVYWHLRADCIKELWDKMHRFKIISKFQYQDLRIQTHLLADQQAKCAL